MAFGSLAGSARVLLGVDTRDFNRTQGAATLTGINAVTYTDASPTVSETISKVWEAFRVIVEGGGGGPGDASEPAK